MLQPLHDLVADPGAILFANPFVEAHGNTLNDDLLLFSSRCCDLPKRLQPMPRGDKPFVLGHGEQSGKITQHPLFGNACRLLISHHAVATYDVKLINQPPLLDHDLQKLCRIKFFAKRKGSSLLSFYAKSFTTHKA